MSGMIIVIRAATMRFTYDVMHITIMNISLFVSQYHMKRNTFIGNRRTLEIKSLKLGASTIHLFFLIKLDVLCTKLLPKFNPLNLQDYS